MGIWNKLTLEVHIKELSNFKKFSALRAPQNCVPVSVNLSTAYEMNYSGIKTQTILTNIPRMSLSVSSVVPELVVFRTGDRSVETLYG